MQFCFPFACDDGSEFKDETEIFKALQAEENGHYLLGRYHYWHGGFTAEEIKEIILTLRQFDPIKSNALFTASNCNFTSFDKTNVLRRF